MNYITYPINAGINAINGALSSFTPVETIISTVITLYALPKLNEWYHDGYALTKKKLIGRVTEFVKSKINNIPVVKYETERKLREQEIQLQKDIFKNRPPVLSALPEESNSSNFIIDKLKLYYNELVEKCNKGEFSGTVYTNPNSGVAEVAALATHYTQFANPLHVDSFKYHVNLENEAVQWIGEIYGGGKGKSCGRITSGGTQSNMAALRAYCNQAKSKGIKHPIILAPISAHDSILTKGQDFGCVIKIPIDPTTCKVDLKKMEKALKHYCKRVACIVGSMQTYAHGIMDPINKLSELALKYKKGLHIDACLSSLYTPFALKLKKIGFQHEGVTSISVDQHKYGQVPKGASTILFRSEELMAHQYYINPIWQGGMYATPGQAGSRSATPGVVTNLTMKMIGKKGYRNTAQEIKKVHTELLSIIRKTNWIKILGRPKQSVIAITSSKFNIYVLAEKLAERGIKFDKMQGPPCNSIHICLTKIHTNPNFKLEKFTKALRQCVLECEEHPNEKPTGEAAIYGLVQPLAKSNPEATREIVSRYVSATLRAQPKELSPLPKKKFSDCQSKIITYLYEHTSLFKKSK